MNTPHSTHDAYLLRGGVELFTALIQAVDLAQQEVLLETYIFHFVGAGVDVAHALMRAAERGVRVCVAVDGVGTGALPPEWAKNFAQAGVQYRVYAPLVGFGFWLPSRWRRLHRKLCVVDQAVAFCGGINILDDFLSLSLPVDLTHPRLDYAVSLRGPLVTKVHDTMTQLWLRIEAMREARSQDLKLPRHGAVQLVLRDNMRHRIQIERTYRKALADARQEIIVANAYFFPSLRLRRALMLAARRGVRVRLLLQGKYEYFLPYRASRQLYGKLLASGVEIYEYHASVLHAKVAVVDGHWATVGSSNLDPFSLLLAHEANVVVRDQAFTHALKESLYQAIQTGATRVDLHTFAHRSAWQKLGDWGASMILRLGVFLTGKQY